MTRQPEHDTDCRKRETQLQQARLALSSAVWYVSRAMPFVEASAFRAVVADLRRWLDRWSAECRDAESND